MEGFKDILKIRKDEVSLLMFFIFLIVHRHNKKFAILTILKKDIHLEMDDGVGCKTE